ncbi:hypothetical protein GBA52_007194 [Prunus armeniaca]|nr:hypothetical protein GBA52_007194 [Prunus armeniaca]
MQRDFVLCHCHLKKNVKKSDEIHTDVATTCDEGEPSTHIASDFEHPPAHDILEEYVDYNALQPAFAANDSDVEFAEFLETVLVEPDGGVTSDTDMEPFHGHGQAEMLSEVFYGSSLPSRDTGGIFRNQISPQAASSVNVAPKPQTDRVQLKSDTSQGARGPRHQPATCDEGETHNASDVENQPVNDMNMEDTWPPENRDYFERARDLLLASSPSNNDHNAFQPAFSAHDQEANFEDFLRTLIVEPQFGVISDRDREPVHHRVYKILQFVESYQNENKLNPMPIILCGDWNGSKRGHVYKFLRSQGFVSTYDTAHQYTDADAHKWVSHRNHRGNICGVDFIWLCNPNKSRKPLKTSWCEAVLGILRGDSNGDFITSSAFCEALHQVNLIGQPLGLGFQETRDLWIQADVDENGVLDYEEFKNRIWISTVSEEKENLNGSREESIRGTQDALGFNVKNAVLYPREVEKGIWPEDYTLSDHARLAVVLSPERMWCSQNNWIFEILSMTCCFKTIARDRTKTNSSMGRNYDEIHTDVATTCDEGEPSTRNAFDVENQPKHGMDIQEEDTQQPENLDYFEQAKDRWLASSCSNNDHNATFADNDSASELEERLRPFNTKPFHAGELSLEMLYELQDGSSQSIQDTDIMLHNQLSRQAASTVNVAPKPQTDRVQLETGETSTHNASDFENQPVHGMVSLEFQMQEDTRPRENLDYFELTRDRWLANSRRNNDHNAFQSDFEANDPEAEEFARSLLIDPQFDTDTDTEPIYVQSPERCEPQMFFEPQYVSSQSRRDTDVMFRNLSSRQASSSVNVAPQPQTSELQLQSGTSERTHRPQPKSINVLRDTSAVNKQISITKSSIDRKVAQGKNAEKDVEQTQNRTTPSNWKGSFITWQTFPLTSPPSVYICNTVLGAILFYFCVREVVLYGKWC